MPRIDPGYLDCTIYLYPNTKAAQSGQNYGGSGFLTAIPYESEIDGQLRSHIYAITNSHVISKDEGNSPTIRFNRHDDKTEIAPYTYEDWIDFGEHDDLAILRLSNELVNSIKWLAFFPWASITPGDVFSRNDFPPAIDIGTDVLMISRFLSHDGKQRNLPVVRFGNLSMLPFEPIPYPNVKGKNRPPQESFLVEARSNPGTSGSPVFTTRVREDGYTVPQFLLGIVWGYSTYRSKVKYKKTKDAIVDTYIDENAGMAMVIPAWKLLPCLYREDMVMERKKIEQKDKEESEERQGGAAPAYALSDNEETNFTEEDFEDALRKVSRREKPKEDKTKK